MDKNIAPHISALVDSFVPEHIEASYPKLVLFLKAYLNFLEDTNKASYYQNTLPEQRDVWQQEQQFLARIQKEIGLYVPRDYAATPKVFYQKIVDLYRSKGSEAAVKTFFQLFINDVVEIYYPWEQVLIPSDGRWIVEDKLRVSMLTGDANLFAGQVIRQVASDAVAKVDKVERRVYSDGVIFELTLVKGTQSGTFEAGQTISAVGGLSAEIYKSVSGFQINKGGSGYVPGDRIRVLGFEGFSFNAFVSAVDPNGAITDIRISNYGAGNTPEHVKDANVSEIFYFKDFDLYRYSSSGQADPEYNNGAIINVSGDGSDFFKREVTTNGVRIMGAGTVGGQTAVPDAWLEKVARMVELFTDPNGAGINETFQRAMIKTLSGDAGTYHAGLPTLQRVARGSGAEYTPNFLTDSGVISWNLTNLFDTHVQNDMVWYLNSSGVGYGDGDIDAQEVIEHVFHTLHMHGLPAADIKLYQFLAADWQSGPLYAAMEEAYDAGKWDPSGYQPPGDSDAWKTDSEYFEVAAKEYLYLLNFCMFEYTELWEGGSLAPEWTDDMRTQAGIQANNPLGYAFHNQYIAPVISKPSLATIRSIFQDGNTPAQDDPSLAGASGYVPDVVGLAVDSTLDISSTNGNSADIDLLFDTVVTTAGEYRGVKGQLSESIVIQDSKFYQKYSYEVSTNYSTDIWLDALKRTVHPAGMEVFGNIRLNEVADNSIKSNVIYTATVAPSEYQVLERPVLKSTPLGFRQDYTVQTEVYFSEAYAGTEDFNLEFIDVTEFRSQGLTDEVFVTQD